jgi:tetratricopeptide (TPR) repeat protein
MSHQLAEINRLRHRGEYDLAGQLAHRLMQATPDDSHLHIALARLAKEQERFSEALALVERAAELAPDDPEPVAWQVAVLQLLCRFDDAAECADSGLKRHPGAAPILVASGRLRLQLLDYAGAVELLGEAVRADPESPQAWEWWITALRWCSRWDEALAAVEEATSRGQDAPDVLMEGSYVHSDRGDYPSALIWAERAVAADPDRPYLVEGVADLLRWLGRHDEAAGRLEQARRWCPQSVTPLVALADARSAQGRDGDALALYRQAENLDGTSYRAVAGVVQQLRLLGRLE